LEFPPLDLPKIARLAMLSRVLDELEVQQLTPQGKVKYQFSAGGHELAQILLAQALDHPHDAAGVYYRSRPLLLACGLTPYEALAGGMARLGSPSHGRDVGVMFNLPARDGLETLRPGPTILPTSGNVGAQYTPAAGWAQAIRYQEQVLGEADWSGALAVACGGDGSVAANGFWAALNIATTLQLPMLFFIEDNGFGLSVPAHMQTPGGNIATNLRAYGGLKVLEGDGGELHTAWGLIQDAVTHIRHGLGPCLLRMAVPRLSGHTFIDDQSYKPAETLAEDAECDPIDRLSQVWLQAGYTLEAWTGLQTEVHTELQQALQEAEASAEPDPPHITSHLFFQGQAPMQGGLRPEGVQVALASVEREQRGPRLNFVDAVRRTLESEMALNSRLLVFGEDVGVKGGVHGATLDMQAHFGAQRVFDTSLSEDGIIGRAAGMALAGLLPVPEIQFRKYADPAHEQLSDLGTLRWRTANRFAAPLVVRIPVGYGKKTGDPWHSVTGEAVFAHLPGWRIAFPSNAADAAGLLRTALRGDDPTFFLEHRALLDTADGRATYPGDEYCLPFGKAAVLAKGNRATLITWGAMLAPALSAAKTYAGQVEVIDLRTIVPWDVERVLESVRATGKALVVHEDTCTAGFAGEITAEIMSQAFTDLDAPVQRLCMPDIPVPYNVTAMTAFLPGIESIRHKLEELLNY